MRVRSKLILVMAVVICFMAVVFFVLANTYLGGLFKQYGQTARAGSAEQVARLLSYYYQSNHNSWNGVDKNLSEVFDTQGPMDRPVRPEYIVVLDANNHVVAEVGPHYRPVGTDVKSLMESGDVTVPVVVGSETVGTLWIRDRGVQGLFNVQQTVLHTITFSTMWGAIITGAVALIMVIWFARRFTRPLQHMLRAIQQLSQGDLETRLTIESKDEFGTVAQAFNNMATQLRVTEEARRHLVADVAHELRTPLTIMQGQLELIQQGVKKAEAKTLLPIQDEVMRLSRLVEDLHLLSLAEAGKLPLEITNVDIVKLVERVVDNFQFESEDKDISLRFEPNVQDSLYLAVDGHRVTQVFVNLISNALRYTPQGGEVKLTIIQQEGLVGVQVADSGPGIAEEHLPYVFDRFYRGEKDRSRGSGGAGLGLSIAKEFVEAHGGHIQTDSIVNRGTTFTVWFPV